MRIGDQSHENTQLAAEVAKLSEFKDVLIEMGLWK
jgi:hypothetical protein